MSKSIDEFFNKKYSSKNYHCAHFACEVWDKLTGDDISNKFGGILAPVGEQVAAYNLRKVFTKLNKPETPCIVLMQRRHSTPHVGIYINGRVLHLKENGVEFQPLDVATLGFTRIGFYK